MVFINRLLIIVAMKTYVLILSRQFPQTHPRAGAETKFFEHIDVGKKVHTISRNYDLWRARIDAVNAGEAVLSLRFWSDKPYRSPQIIAHTFTSGEVGIQKLCWTPLGWFVDDFDSDIRTKDIAENDSLSRADFIAWFKGCENIDLAVIHFTRFRYCNSAT